MIIIKVLTRALCRAGPLAIAVSLTTSAPAFADDCSGPDDCRNVVQGGSLLGILLAIILAGLAARQRGKKRKPPKPKTEKKKFNDCQEFVDWLRSDNEAGLANPEFDPHMTVVDIKSSGDTTSASTTVTWGSSDARSKTTLWEPTWPNMTKADSVAVKDFMTKVGAHEEGHHAEAQEFMEKAGETITGEGDTPEEARKDLREKVEAYKEDVKERLDQNTDEYDLKTDHGRNQASVGGRNTIFTCSG